eukprot:CAMPEP_0194303616 /NCGR_PEP_ID=MMETSP0171-20130528/1459_1 /TAXON_ID=218684 /ORGANISM="Corethron pennatum, Strain L29A3" /LENGTH=253 /DNA_ID=CAMNT_0039054575 /DNA_START=384 /DNA_END=1147 /DNA_ORIENTATION=-
MQFLTPLFQKKKNYITAPDVAARFPEPTVAIERLFDADVPDSERGLPFAADPPPSRLVRRGSRPSGARVRPGPSRALPPPGPLPEPVQPVRRVPPPHGVPPPRPGLPLHPDRARVFGPGERRLRAHPAPRRVLDVGAVLRERRPAARLRSAAGVDGGPAGGAAARVCAEGALGEVVDFFDRKKDDYWPWRDAAKDGEESPPELSLMVPGSSTFPDPPNACSVEVAAQISSGQLSSVSPAAYESPSLAGNDIRH